MGLGGIWLIEINSIKFANRTTHQFNVWKQFLKQYALEFNVDYSYYNFPS